MKGQKFQTKSKGASKTKQTIKSYNYNPKNKEANKLSKSSTKKIVNKSTSFDIKKNKSITGSTKFKSQIITDEEEKNLRISQDTINSKILKTDIDYSRNLISEKKVKNSIKRLIDTSQNLLKEQNNILIEANKLMQNIEVNEHEINKIQKRENLSNFSGSINEYTENLDLVLSKLKKNAKDIENLNKIKEDNNNLKYRMQILSIDKNDDYRKTETELNSIKNVYSNQINDMLRFLIELGFDNMPIDQIAPSNLNTDKIINFFNLIKRTMKNLKDDNMQKEEQIKRMNKYKQMDDNINTNIENKLFNNTEYINKTNKEFPKYNTQKSLNTLNNNKLYNTTNNINTLKNDRIKKIEDLCLQHNYEDDNKNPDINIRNTYQLNSNQNETNERGQSYIDVFQRSKNMNNNDNSLSGIQLDHNYTDSYFYQNTYLKDSYFNDNSNINKNENIKLNSDNNINDKEYTTKINQSQPLNKFV